MAGFNFPQNPKEGDKFPVVNPKYIWNGVAWLSLTSDSDIDLYESARVGQSLSKDELVKATVGTSITNASRIYDEASGKTFNVTGKTGAVTFVSPTLGTTGIIQINGNDVVLPRATPVVESEIYVEAFQFGAVDNVVMIQAAIDFIEASGKRTLLKFGKSSYKLQSVHTGTKPPEMAGKKQCLVVKRPDLVWIDGCGCMLGVDSDNMKVAALDEILAYGSSEHVASEGMIKDLSLSGGSSWTDKTNEPNYLIRADYTTHRYSTMSNVSGKYCRESNLKISGFVLEFDNCDFRNAQARANFEAISVAVDGSVPAAKTGIFFSHCTADYAGLYGYSVAGGSGHTYVAFVNSTADHIGRTRHNVTIPANLGVSAGYYINAGFSVEMLACGSEFSTRAIRAATCKGLSIRGLYCNGNGTTDGTLARENIMISGYTEDLRIEGYRENESTTQEYILSIENPAAFNRNSCHICSTIPNSKILYVGGTKTSANAQVMRVEDFYKRSMRNPAGGSLLQGRPLAGNTVEDFASMNSNAHEFDFTHVTAAPPQSDRLSLLKIIDPTREGYLSVIVTVDIGKSTGYSSPVLPQRLVGRAAILNNVFLLEDFLPQFGTVNEYGSLELYWSGSELRIKTEEVYAQHHITVKCVGRPSIATMAYEVIASQF